MTTVVTLQTQVHNAETVNYSARIPKEKQKPLSPEMIRALLDVSPEMQQIDDLVDRRCYALHQDGKLSEFSILFQGVIKENEELFSSKTTTEQASLLYQFHSDAIVNPIMSEKIPAIVDAFLQQLGPLSKDAEIITTVRESSRRALYARVNYLHSGYVRVAAATALEVSIKDLPHLSFPIDYPEIQARSLNLDLYKNTH